MKKTIIIALITSNILANDTTNLDDLSLEELMNIKIYSATKDYRSVEDIPANITIVTRNLTRKDIEKYNFSTLEELLNTIPGLFVFDDTENFQVASRGSYGSSFQLMLNNNPIFSQRFPADFTSNRNFFSIPIESIDRIEIVKGPQAVTYGSNSMYGSINVITNDFNEKNSVSFGVGNNNQKKSFARINHSHENGGFTLNTSFFNTDGINNPETNPIKENLNLKVANTFPNKYKTLDFSNRYKNLTTDVFYSDGDINLAVPIYRDIFKTYQTEKALSLTYDDDITNNLSYKINYIKSEKNLKQPDFNDYTTDLYDSNAKFSHHKDKFDFHFNYKLYENIKILLGSSFEKQSFDYSKSIYNFYPSGSTYQDYKTKDVYSKINYVLNNNWEFNAGVRKTKTDSFETHKFADYGIYYPQYSIDQTNNIDGASKYLPEFSTIYHINSNNHLKFLYGKANQLQKNTYNIYENIESKEINHIYFSKNYDISNSIFINKTSNIFAHDYINLGEKETTYTYETKGLETALTYKINDNFELSPSLTYQHSENLDNKDLKPVLSPEFIGKLSATYLHNDTRYTSWINYLSSMKANRGTNNTPYGEDTGSNITLNANINHKLNKTASFNINAINLLDRDNRIPANGVVSFFKDGFYTPKRTILFTLDYKF